MTSINYDPQYPIFAGTFYHYQNIDGKEKKLEGNQFDYLTHINLKLPETHFKFKEVIDDYKRRFPLKIGEPLEFREPSKLFRIINMPYKKLILQNYLNNKTQCIENVTYDDDISTFYNYRTFDYDKYFNFIIKFNPIVNGNPSEIKCIKGWIPDSILFRNNPLV